MLCRRFWIYLVGCLLLTFNVVASSEVQLPQGEYYTNIDDLQVKVLGGRITVRRTWYKDRWYFNRAWESLSFEAVSTYSGPVGAQVETKHVTGILRNDDEYKLNQQLTVNALQAAQNCYVGNINPDTESVALCIEHAYRAVDGVGVVYPLDGKSSISEKVDSISRTDSGYRWKNTSGDWIDYDSAGLIQAYGGRAGTTTTFHYDTEGRLSGVKDRQDTQILWYEYNSEGLLQFVRDTTDRQVEYRYSGEVLSESIDVRGSGTTYAYNETKLTSITDPEGRINEISYGISGRVEKEILRDGEGSSLQTLYGFDYDKTKKEFYVKMKGPTGIITERWYDKRSRQIRKAVNGNTTFSLATDDSGSAESRITTDRRGLKTTKDYDEWSNIVKTTYADGSILRAKYKAGTSLVEERIDELGHITRYDYDATGYLIRLTEAAATTYERITEYRYDTDGQRIEKKQLGDANSDEAITTYGYDNKGNLTTITGPEDGVTRFTHNSRGNVLTRTNPNNKTWTYTYDPAGNVLTETDPLGHLTTYTYDKVGNRQTSKDARTHTTSFSYDLQDNRISLTDPLAKNMQYSYDAEGRLIGLTDPLGNTQTLIYDLEGRLINQQDPASNNIALGYGDKVEQGGGLTGNTSYPGLLNRTQYPTFLQTYDYDRRNRRTHSIDHLDTGALITTTEYDAMGNRIKATDAEGRVTQYHYDDLNRLVEIIDPLNQSTGFSYDNRNNLLSVTDPNGHTTQYSYDRADQKTRETRPGGQIISYTYDDAGNLTSTIDPDGRKTINTYDDAGQLHQQFHYTSGQTASERTVTYSFDPNGNLTGYTAESCTTADYAECVIAASDRLQSASYQYDANNRKTEETTDYGPFSLTHRYTYDATGNKQSYIGPDNTTVTYHWDKNRLSRIALPNEGSIYYNTYKWTQPDKITWPGGSVKQTNYDELMRPTQIQTQDPGGNATLDFQYRYDNTGNINQKVTPQTTYDYSYDFLQRLTEAATEEETEGWSYDPNGNRTSDNLNPGAWSYDENDRLLQSPVTTYTYDNAGNTTSKTENSSTTHYRYNAEGRLRKVDDSNSTLIAESVYDPLGRRIKKTTQTETLYFHYTDEGLAGEYTASGTPIRQYGYTPDSTWTTDPLYQKTDQGYAYYQTDHLGTPQQLLKKNGAKVWEASYKAFGEVDITNNAWENRLRFPGQYHDEEIGEYYNYFRNYVPGFGRYTQADPIGFGGGLNTYSYVGSNPLYWIDPTGESWREWVQAIGIAIGLSGSPGWFSDLPNPGDTQKPTPIQPGKAVGKQLLDPKKNTIRPELPRPQRPIPTPPKNFKPPPSPSAARIPAWGLGPAAVGIGAILYPRPLGCATLDCPDYQKIVEEFCKQNPSAPNCEPSPDGCK